MDIVDISRRLEDGEGCAQNSSSNNEIRIEKDFSGYQWFMERMRVGQGVAEGIHLLPNELSGNDFSWNIAHVPGDVYTDLYNAGEIDDPIFGRNMGRAKWVQDYEWWYTYSFNVPEQMDDKDITLIFEGVDYSCDVWLNSTHLGRHEGMMSSFKFTVTDLIHHNRPLVPENKIIIKLDPPPKNQKNFAGMKHNFAGDYLTGLIPFGIWKPVKLIATKNVRMDNYRIETQVSGNDAAVNFEVDITGFKKATQNLMARISLSDGEKSHTCETAVHIEQGSNQFTAQINVKDAKLWWPYDLGDSFLYDLDITVFDGDLPLDNIKEKAGLREVTMQMNPGFTNDESELPWTFVINGKPLFLRAACWGGQPSFFYGRNSDEKYRFYLENAKTSNINSLRIFGWHPAETQDFYHICDELGIMVWTNFSFATQVFRDDQAYIDKVCEEIAGTVKNIRNHPSTIMWMGGEEVYYSEAHVESNNKKLMETIGKVTRSLTNVPYADASPLSTTEGVKLGYKTKESAHANSHYYAAGAIFMEDYYPHLDFCIIPELTAASSPNVSSLKKFIPENELWPMGPSWGYHAADVHVLRNLNYEVFGDTCMDSLEHFVDATQIAQGTVFQFALEHYRRCKPRVSGVALCHYITNWPIIKWDIIDYYGEYKKSYEYVKRCYQPLLPSMKYAKRRYLPSENFEFGLWVVNDHYAALRGVLYSYEILNQDGHIVSSDRFLVDIGENSSAEFKKINWVVEGKIGESFNVRLSLKNASGDILSNNEYRLLIADQEKAKEEAMQLYLNMHAAKDKYGRGYYRYTPNWIDIT